MAAGDLRVTQAGVEVLVEATRLRATQAAVEVVVDTSTLLVTQAAMEVLVDETAVASGARAGDFFLLFSVLFPSLLAALGFLSCGLAGAFFFLL